MIYFKLYPTRRSASEAFLKAVEALHETADQQPICNFTRLSIDDQKGRTTIYGICPIEYHEIDRFKGMTIGAMPEFHHCEPTSQVKLFFATRIDRRS